MDLNPAELQRLMAEDALGAGDVREPLIAAAGAPPSLWPGVARAIGAPSSETGALLRAALIDAAEVAPPVQVAKSYWRVGVAVLAMAAAVTLAVVVGENTESVEPVLDVVAVEFDNPGRTEIESLESETAMVVQVLQFDDDAPTIIFIDETPFDLESQ
jgi:hypothetical protein